MKNLLFILFVVPALAFGQTIPEKQVTNLITDLAAKKNVADSNRNVASSYVRQDRLANVLDSNTKKLLQSISFTAPGALFGSPVSFSNSNGAWTGALLLSTQSAYKLFGTGSSSASPSFVGPLDSNYLASGFHTQLYYDGVYAAISHTHAFSSLTSKPTTLSGYGITDIPLNADAATNKYLNWNGSAYVRKQIDYSEIAGTPSLSGYELLSNKATSFSTVNNTLYPSVQAVVNYVGAQGFLTTESDPTVSSTIKNIPVATDHTTNKYLQWNDGSYARKQIDYSELSGTPTIPSQYTDEMAQDAVGNILSGEFTYNDAGNAISINSIAASKITGTKTSSFISDFNSAGDARWLPLSGGNLTGRLRINSTYDDGRNWLQVNGSGTFTGTVKATAGVDAGSLSVTSLAANTTSNNVLVMNGTSVEKRTSFDSTLIPTLHSKAYYDGIYQPIGSYQSTLVSGTNIKTINGISLLGSGDLVISGGGGGTTTPTLQQVTAQGNSTNKGIVIADAVSDVAPTSSGFSIYSLASKPDVVNFYTMNDALARFDFSNLERDDVTYTFPDANGTVLLSSTVKTINGNSIVGSGNITISGAGDLSATYWALNGNYATPGSQAGSFIGSLNNTSLRIRSNNIEVAKFDSTGSQLYLENGLNPLVSLKQKTTNKEWQLRGNFGDGLSSSNFNIYDASNSKVAFNISDYRHIAFGNVTYVPSESLIYAFGGANGANLDIRPDSNLVDEGNIEIEHSDYYGSGNPRFLGMGIAMQFDGNKALSTSSLWGYSPKNMAQLRFSGDLNLIRVRTGGSLRFGGYNPTAGTEREWMVIDSSGHLGVNVKAPSYFVDVNGDVNVSSGSHYKINGTNLSYSEVGAQATLVSGTNIKTVNGNSLLGSGDITFANHTAGAGLSGSNYNGSSAQTWTVDQAYSFTLSGKNTLSGGLAVTSYQTITTGSSSTVSDATTKVVFNPSSDLSSYTLTLPASPIDGQEIEIIAGGTIPAGSAVSSSFTLSPNTGQSMLTAITPTQLYSGDVMLFTYKSSNTTWYRKK